LDWIEQDLTSHSTHFRSFRWRCKFQFPAERKNNRTSTSCRQNVCLRHYGIRSVHDLDLWLLTLKPFLPMPTHVLSIHAKFHWNPSTKYRDIASREIDVNGQRPDARLDGIPENMLPPLRILWRR